MKANGSDAIYKFINYAKPFTRITFCGISNGFSISHRHFSVGPNGLCVLVRLCCILFFFIHLFQHSDFACCIIDKLLKSKLYFDVDTVHHYCRWLWKREIKINENTIKTNTAGRRQRRRWWSCEKSQNFSLNYVCRRMGYLFTTDWNWMATEREQMARFRIRLTGRQTPIKKKQKHFQWKQSASTPLIYLLGCVFFSFSFIFIRWVSIWFKRYAPA